MNNSNQDDKTVIAIKSLYKNLYVACDLMKLVKELEICDEINGGHKRIFETVDNALEQQFEFIEVIENEIGKTSNGVPISEEDNESTEELQTVNNNHPAWWSIGLDGEVSDMNLRDSLESHFRELDAFGDMVTELDNANIQDSTLPSLGWMLINKAKEGDALLGLWRKDKRGES